jgi:hypothetical protein
VRGVALEARDGIWLTKSAILAGALAAISSAPMTEVGVGA